ncbi:MAG: cell division protein SepF [Erysipelotrichales bacterium]|nr:cell division protein SepF [Erysipelotrichales bacterium]
MAFKDFTNALFPKDNGVDVVDTEEEAYEKGSDVSSSKTGAKMILVEPRAFSESQQIADHLKRRNSVVVNLKRVTNDQARRIIDFLSGTLYAIGGELQRLGYGIYLCTPKNVNVEGRISDEESEKKAKSKIEDEMDF